MERLRRLLLKILLFVGIVGKIEKKLSVSGTAEVFEPSMTIGEPGFEIQLGVGARLPKELSIVVCLCF